MQNRIVTLFIGFIMGILFAVPFVSAVSSADLLERVRGKILIRVENKGEAWYVNPDDDKRYFLGRPADAFNLMRMLGLGITDVNLFQIPLAPGYFDRDVKATNLIYQGTDPYFSVEYPAGWAYQEQGEPDSTLLKWVYFYPGDTKETKGFDTIHIRMYSSKERGYADEIKKEGAKTYEANGVFYVFNFNSPLMNPTQTYDVFNAMFASFKTVE